MRMSPWARAASKSKTPHVASRTATAPLGPPASRPAKGGGNPSSRHSSWRKNWPFVLSAVAGALVVGAGCERAPEDGASTPSSAASASAVASTNASERTFQTRGEIREIPAARTTLVIKHEEIPGYMPKMTMELTLANTNEAAGLQVGDVIEFRLVARAEDHFIDQLKRVGQRPAAGATSPADAAVIAAGNSSAPREEGEPPAPPELKVGDPMPDVELASERGRPLRFADLRGQAVAFTFFFTRCPLPDFCPLMNRNFERARTQLKETPGSPTNWMFLSISFDAEFDKPQVLVSHAAIYRDDDADRWLFAAAAEPALRKLARPLDLKVIREGGSFSHNLRTVVLDTEGRVFRQFDGNQWKATELAEALAEAARKK